MSETARALMVAPVATAAATDVAAAVVESLRGRSLADASQVHVIDGDGRFVGLVPLRDLLAAPHGAALGEFMRRDVVAVPADTDQEQVAAIARDSGLGAVPVTDAAGRLLGVVPAAAIIEVLGREHAEDLHRLVGILHAAGNARRAMEDSPLERVRRRVPWLLVGLAGSAFATIVVARFERVLDDYVAIAFFMPAIVYLADAIGTQTETAAVRGLSLVRRPLARILWGEAATGFLISVILAALAVPFVLATFGDFRLAGAVALSVVGAGTIAATVGLLFPWALSRAGFDPAYGSGPVATIVQDVLSLAVYLVLALWLVRAG
jgi:magnesium transporter